MQGASVIRKLMPIVLFIVLISGCRTMSPPRFYALSDEPMRNSYAGFYLELQEVYDSDGQIFVMGWADVEKEGTYVMELKMLNPKGETIYTYKKDVKSDTNKGEITVGFWNTIHLDPDLTAKLSPGNITIHIYCDGKLLDTKQIKYTPGSIINPNVNQVVVLPFYSSTQSTVERAYRDGMLNTFAYTVTNEVKRVAKEVIPHYVAEQKLSDKVPQKCLNDPACRERLKETFGEAIVIEGDVILPYYVDFPYELKITLFNTKTGEVKGYKNFMLCTEGSKISTCVKSLIKSILYQQGLLAYIRGL